MWEPLPLSSLDPAPSKNPSSPERKATFPEQELQQLEIGTASGSPGFLPFPAPSPWIGPCSLCRKTPGRTAGPLPVFHSLLLLRFAELFLNSLSQPFSLEEQEQILSCLSIDSLSLSDDSEKVSGP